MGVCGPQGLCRAGFGGLCAPQSQAPPPPALAGVTDTEQMPPLILCPLLPQTAPFSHPWCTVSQLSHQKLIFGFNEKHVVGAREVEAALKAAWLMVGLDDPECLL